MQGTRCDAERVGCRRVVVDVVLCEADTQIEGGQLVQEAADVLADGAAIDAPGHIHAGRLLAEEVDAHAVLQLAGEALLEELLLSQRDHRFGSGASLPSFCHVANRRWKAVRTVAMARIQRTGWRMSRIRPTVRKRRRTHPGEDAVVQRHALHFGAGAYVADAQGADHGHEDEHALFLRPEAQVVVEDAAQYSAFEHAVNRRVEDAAELRHLAGRAGQRSVEGIEARGEDQDDAADQQAPRWR